MSQLKKTKIVATLGPATDDKETLKAMILAGANVFRINFSHADYDEVRRRVQYIRELNEELGIHTALLADLQGPKLRVGIMENAHLNNGDTFTFTTEECVGDATKAFMTYQAFPRDVKAGEHILVDDGKLLFEVIETDGEKNVVTKVIRGGELKSKKGVNLPNTDISLPALTEKDIPDALFAIELDVDWIALSFVRKAQDIKDIHELIEANSEFKIPVVAKIEKPEAVANIDELIPLLDGLMVARGDLGVEIPMQEVPLVQKTLVRKAKAASIPVIIATQMMETMIENLVPTRAEVNDVANSIMDGADAVMLSGETSVGVNPPNVIEHMSKIILGVENSDLIKVPHDLPSVESDRYITQTVCQHAAVMATSVNATAVTTVTASGYTAYQISSWRPNAHILVYTNNKKILTTLSLVWGVKVFYYNNLVTTDQTVKEINDIGKEKGFLTEGDLVVNLTSMPVQEQGMVNTLRLSKI